MNAATVFMPMPSTMQDRPISTRVAKKEPPDQEMMALLMLSPTPVSVNTPMTNPTTAQVMMISTAPRAPRSIASRIFRGPSRVSLRTQLTSTVNTMA